MKGLPIFNSLTKELTYLYVPKIYFDRLTNSMKLKANHFYDDDNIDSLNSIICQYLNDTFLNCPLEKRLEKSFYDLGNIIPVYSFILRPDENFLNKPEIRKILGNFRELKNQIIKIQNLSNDDSFLNPFMKEDKKIFEEDYEEEEDEDNEDEYYEYMNMNIWEIYRNLKYLKKTKLVPKKGVSLLTKNEKNLLEHEKSLGGLKRPNSSDKLFVHKSTTSLNELKLIRKTKNIYTKLIKDIFCTKLADFRSELIIYCLKFTKVNSLMNDSFEKFVCFLEFFITLYTGVRTKYFLDELTNLNMDFYADENNFMNFAETFRYKVQFRIKDIPIIYDSEQKVYRKRDNSIINEEKFHISKFLEINQLNEAQFEQFNFNQVEYFPPYANFIKELSAYYRRYDSNDKIHICLECKNIEKISDCLQIKCQSSCFKKLDKEKLIYKSLMTIMSDDNICDCWTIKDSILINNYKTILDNTGIFSLIITFLTPVETIELKRVNKIFSDSFYNIIS